MAVKYKKDDSWVNLALEMYPVGCFYSSNSATSPASLFGGTWTQVINAVLRSATSVGYNSSDTMTLTVSQMPSHTHTPSRRAYVYSAEHKGNANGGAAGMDYASYGYLVDNGNASAITPTGSTGGGGMLSQSYLGITTTTFGIELLNLFGGEVVWL